MNVLVSRSGQGLMSWGEHSGVGVGVEETRFLSNRQEASELEQNIC
jgi:hypothetical protein